MPIAKASPRVLIRKTLVCQPTQIVDQLERVRSSQNLLTEECCKAIETTCYDSASSGVRLGKVASVSDHDYHLSKREKDGNRLVPGPDYMMDALKLPNQAPRVLESH
ncbi:hypothetical protein TNCV_4022191 [Trichonephila clavipes]|nr:hypothetical protein TNCV_4022191 [Trichonephila clavipes]